MKNVLTIAGSDPSSAAGVPVDLQVIRDHGHYGLSCITAVVAQNTVGVIDWVAVEPNLIASQLDAVLRDIEVDAIKIGVTPTPQAARVIATALRDRPIPIVIDPVLTSGDGARALVRDGTAEAILEHLFPIATVVTPNANEAAVLLGESLDSDPDLPGLSARLASRFGAAVLVKAGHAVGDTVQDILVTDDQTYELEVYPRIGDDVRGTGCQLSTAIACQLAAGTPLVESVEKARAYLQHLLRHQRGPLGKGRLVIKRNPLS